MKVQVSTENHPSPLPNVVIITRLLNQVHCFLNCFCADVCMFVHACVCVCVCAHACLRACVPALRLLITSDVICYHF